MDINTKEILLYGTDRLKKDFKYLFPNCNIVGYIVDKDNEINLKEQKYYKFNDIKQEFLKDKLLVICLRKEKGIIRRLEKKKLIDKKDYYWFEDLGFLLNNNLDAVYDRIETWQKKHIKRWGGYISPYKTNEQLLKQMIYTDSIEGFRCEVPFKYINVQPDGYAYSCCPGWAYNRAGNLFLNTADEIWNSNALKLFRLSIINKTYAFCDKTMCPYLKKEFKLTNTRFEDLKPYKTPKELYIAIDKSCNLKCKSCRKKYYNAKGVQLKLIDKLAKKITDSDWIKEADRLVLAGQGEVFFSKVYKKMLYESDMTKRESIEILTNGTLMNKQNLDRLVSIYSDIQIYITIDAATEETYNKIRVGGNFKKLMENLEYLSKLRKEEKVKKVELLFVVQRDNYKEMIDYIKLSKRLGFDKVNFSQISDWATYSKEEFKEVSMIDENGKPKKELQEVLDEPILKQALYEHSNITKFIN